MDSARATQQRDTVDRAADKDRTVLIASTGIVDSNEGVLRIKGCLGRDAVSQDLLGRALSCCCNPATPDASLACLG
jgi:hypothetical protein